MCEVSKIEGSEDSNREITECQVYNSDAKCYRIGTSYFYRHCIVKYVAVV